MKIIHLVLGKANPERMNGVNRVVHQLAAAQKDLGAEVSLWGITPDPTHNYPSRNYETELFQARPNKLVLDPELKQAIRTIEFKGASAQVMFHIHGGFIPEFYHVARMLQKFSIAYLYTPHGAYNPVALLKNAFQKKIYFSLFEKKIITGAKAVHFLGQSSFDHMNLLHYINHKVLISNGIDLSSIPSMEKPKNEDLLFATCSRIDIHTKGMDILLEGFAQYRRGKGQGKLRVIGDGDELPTLQRMAAHLSLTEFIEFCGARYGLEKYQLLKQADVFIQVSRNEGFPVTVLEAAGLGLPCLVSEATNVGSFIRQYEAGFVLQKNDARHLASELHKAADWFAADRLAGLGSNARHMARERFDWSKVAQEYLDLYSLPLARWMHLRKEKAMQLKRMV